MLKNYFLGLFKKLLEKTIYSFNIDPPYSAPPNLHFFRLKKGYEGLLAILYIGVTETNKNFTFSRKKKSKHWAGLEICMYVDKG
jgi:hypothetical protein